MTRPIHPSELSISDFQYALPEERIAAYPLENRQASKLLVYRNKNIEASQFDRVNDFLPEKAVLVFNNTRVINARLKFKTAQGHVIELFCLEPSQYGLNEPKAGTAEWKCLAGKLKRWSGEPLHLQQGTMHLTASLVAKHPDHVLVKFEWSPSEFSFEEILQRFGQIPIPPYLKREADSMDATRYQTVFAQKDGSVAAPTAGLHFTPDLMQKLGEGGFGTEQLTLHVGTGTFKPVKSETMQGHTMHAEWLEVNLQTIRNLKEYEEGRLIAVGTTSLRTLESLYWMGVKLLENPDINLNDLEIKQWEVYDKPTVDIRIADSMGALESWLIRTGRETLFCKTQILIAPPYRVRMVSGIITNFHQPQSTLLLLVAALVGEAWRDIYRFALEHDFRFLSYGDSSLLLK